MRATHGKEPGHNAGRTWLDRGVRIGLMLFFIGLCTSVAIQQTLLGVMLGVGACHCWRTQTAPRTPLDPALLLLGGALLLSSLLSPDPLHSLPAHRKLWLVGAFFVAYVLIDSRQCAVQLIRLVIITAAALAAYGVVQHYTGLDLARQLVGKEPSLTAFWLGSKEGFRTAGLFPSGITYAHNLLFPLCLVTAFLLAPAKGWRTRAGLGLGWGLMVMALLFSLTRGVWIAYAGVLVLAGLVRGRRALAGALGALGVCGVLLLGAGDGVRERAGQIFDLNAPANLARSRIWQANIAMIRDRPLFGWGYGNYKQFRAPYYARYPAVGSAGWAGNSDAHAHNTFLQLWVDGGWPGFVAFISLLAAVLAKGWQTYTRLAEPLKSCALGILLGLVGFLIGGLTQHNFGDAEVSIVLWALVGVLLRLERWTED